MFATPRRIEVSMGVIRFWLSAAARVGVPSY
jgi:hypothetical protein